MIVYDDFFFLLKVNYFLKHFYYYLKKMILWGLPHHVSGPDCLRDFRG